MKAKCITTELKVDLSDDLLNYELSGTLELGKEYKIYRIKHSSTCYYLIFDGSHLIEVPFQMFEIIENKIPENWIVNVESNIISIGPKLFNADYWFDDFSELPEDSRIREIENL